MHKGAPKPNIQAQYTGRRRRSHADARVAAQRSRNAKVCGPSPLMASPSPELLPPRLEARLGGGMKSNTAGLASTSALTTRAHLALNLAMLSPCDCRLSMKPGPWGTPVSPLTTPSSSSSPHPTLPLPNPHAHHTGLQLSTITLVLIIS